MSGSDQDKFNCILEAQEALFDKVSDIEREAAAQGERVQNNFEQYTNRENLLKGQIQELVSLSRDVHINQKVLLKERQYSIDFWRRMKEKIATAGALGALGLLGTVVWYAIQQYLLHGPKG